MEEKIISKKELDLILEYVKENYDTLGYMGDRRNANHISATREFSINQGFKTSAFISIFPGDKFRSVSVYMRCKTKERDRIGNRGCTIEKEIFSLEELKNLESKAKELEQFTLNLGLWK